MKTLLIDDVRDIHCDVVVRNAEAAKAILSCGMHFETVYLDHDLGLGESGLDLLRLMLNDPSFLRPREIVLVTMNPVGRRVMEAELNAAGYVRHADSTRWTDGTASDN